MSKKSSTFAPLFIGARVHAYVRASNGTIIEKKNDELITIRKQLKDKIQKIWIAKA